MGTEVALINADFEIAAVDPGLLSFFGYADARGDDLEVLDRLTSGIERDAELLIRWRELVSEPGATERIEVRLRSADDDWRWARMDIVNTLDAEEPCLLVDAIDVTESRFAEQRYLDMVATNARLTGIIQATSDLVVMTEPDGTPIYLNQAAEDFYGIDGDEMTADDLNGRFPRWVAARVRARSAGDQQARLDRARHQRLDLLGIVDDGHVTGGPQLATG